MDVQGYQFPLPAVWTCTGYPFRQHQQYEPIYLYYHFVLSFMSCYYHFMLSFFWYHLILSFGIIVYFLFEPINKDWWYFYPNIVTKLSKIWVLGPGDQDLGSEIRDPKNLGSMIKPQPPFCQQQKNYLMQWKQQKTAIISTKPQKVQHRYTLRRIS